MGPNEKKLITRKMALIMIPPGGCPLDGFNALTGNLSEIAKEAMEWVKSAIAVVKTAPDNPYATNEEIAGAILEKL